MNEKNKHRDNHATAFLPGDRDYILNGSDGGVYGSRDGAKTWRYFDNLPVTQFHKLALDNDAPFYNVRGGNGADGYATAIEPTDPDTIEWQQGNLLRHDRGSHQAVSISPHPEDRRAPARSGEDSKTRDRSAPCALDMFAPPSPPPVRFSSARRTLTGLGFRLVATDAVASTGGSVPQSV